MRGSPADSRGKGHRGSTGPWGEAQGRRGDPPGIDGGSWGTGGSGRSAAVTGSGRPARPCVRDVRACYGPGVTRPGAVAASGSGTAAAPRRPCRRRDAPPPRPASGRSSRSVTWRRRREAGAQRARGPAAARLVEPDTTSPERSSASLTASTITPSPSTRRRRGVRPAPPSPPRRSGRLSA